MKYFSEVTKKLYDSPEALDAAEKLVAEKKVKEEKKRVEEATSKKQLVAAIEKADAVVEDCKAQYELAKKKVEEISKKYLEDVDAIMEPAKKAVKDAEAERYECIRKFNELYGPYTRSYTGTKAANEFAKTLDDLNRINSDFFKRLFW